MLHALILEACNKYCCDGNYFNSGKACRQRVLLIFRVHITHRVCIICILEKEKSLPCCWSKSLLKLFLQPIIIKAPLSSLNPSFWVIILYVPVFHSSTLKQSKNINFTVELSVHKIRFKCIVHWSDRDVKACAQGKTRYSTRLAVASATELVQNEGVTSFFPVTSSQPLGKNDIILLVCSPHVKMSGNRYDMYCNIDYLINDRSKFGSGNCVLYCYQQ